MISKKPLSLDQRDNGSFSSEDDDSSSAGRLARSQGELDSRFDSRLARLTSF